MLHWSPMYCALSKVEDQFNFAISLLVKTPSLRILPLPLLPSHLLHFLRFLHSFLLFMRITFSSHKRYGPWWESLSIFSKLSLILLLITLIHYHQCIARFAPPLFLELLLLALKVLLNHLALVYLLLDPFPHFLETFVQMLLILSWPYIFKTTLKNYGLYFPQTIGIPMDIPVMFSRMMMIEKMVESANFFYLLFLIYFFFLLKTYNQKLFLNNKF